MLFPTIVIDNFFDDPEIVLKHAETFDCMIAGYEEAINKMQEIGREEVY